MKKRYIEFSHAFNKSSPLRPIFIDGVAAFLGLRDETPEYYNGWRSFSDHHDIWSGEAGTITAIEAQASIGVPGRPGGWFACLKWCGFSVS
eukprot:m.223199 g.223199  ORF g.223199 m.223199 type:complete len:91 (+) comp15941_c0_seq39:726-998(+)